MYDSSRVGYQSTKYQEVCDCLALPNREESVVKIFVNKGRGLLVIKTVILEPTSNLVYRISDVEVSGMTDVLWATSTR